MSPRQRQRRKAEGGRRKHRQSSRTDAWCRCAGINVRGAAGPDRAICHTFRLPPSAFRLSSLPSAFRLPTPRAFTILEVLLALGIVALVMAALGPALVGSLRAERHARATVGPLVDEPAAVARLRDDLLAVPRPTGTLAQPFTVTSAMIDGRRGDSLAVFTCNALPLHPSLAIRDPEVGQAVVTWAVQASASGRGLAWTRSRAPQLLATGTLAEPVAEVVLDHLASLAVEAYADGAFVTAYDSSDRDDVLPLAVRVTWRRLLDDGSEGPAQVVIIDLPLVALDPNQSGSGS